MISRVASRTDPMIAQMNYRNSAEAGHTARYILGCDLGVSAADEDQVREQPSKINKQPKATMIEGRMRALSRRSHCRTLIGNLAMFAANP